MRSWSSRRRAVSKVEGRVRVLADVEPGERALGLAAELDKDAAVMELVLEESERIVRAERGVLITETRAAGSAQTRVSTPPTWTRARYRCCRSTAMPRPSGFELRSRALRRIPRGRDRR